MTKAQQLQYHMTNLLLADKIAIAYADSRHAAIVRWARRVREVATDEKILALTGSILSSPPKRVVAMLGSLEKNMIEHGVLEDYVSA